MFELIAEIPVAADSLETLKQIASTHQCAVERVGRRRESNVVQVLSSGVARELWVRPGDGETRGYSGYKSAWQDTFDEPLNAYLQKWNKMTGDSRSDEVHLDHLLPDMVAGRLNYAFVRVFPVLGPVNAHFGRSFEKEIKKQTTAGNVAGRVDYRGGVEYMNILSLGKVLNFELLHARYKGGAPSNRNKEFLEFVTNPNRTTQLLRDLGLLWW